MNYLISFLMAVLAMLFGSLAFAQEDGSEGILALAVTIFTFVATVITSAKSITILTPTQVDDRWLGYGMRFINLVLRILNVLAANVGKDRNADDPS